LVLDELGSRRGRFDEHASAGHQDDLGPGQQAASPILVVMPAPFSRTPSRAV